MPKYPDFLESMASGVRSLLLSAPWDSWVPEFTWSRQLAKAVWLRWSQKVEKDHRSGDLDEFLGMDPVALSMAIESLVQSKGTDLSPEMRYCMQSLLMSSQDLVRNSFRRSKDPNGNTTPKWFVPTDPVDLSDLIPHGIPQHRPEEFALDGKLALKQLLDLNSWAESWKADSTTNRGNGIRKNGKPATLPKLSVIYRLFPTKSSVEAMTRQRNNLLEWRESLNSLGIFRILKANHDGDIAWLIHGYQGGWSISNLVHEIHKDASAESFQRLARWIKRFATLIGQCHAVGAVHGIIHPKSFQMVKDPKQQVAKAVLVDLGVGLIALETVLEEGKRTRSALLTPGHPWHYGSPQWKKGLAPVSTDDVHALGMLWFHILMNDFQAPPPGDMNWADKILEMGFSPKHARIISRAISPMAQKRQGSAVELANEIEDLVK